MRQRGHGATGLRDLTTLAVDPGCGHVLRGGGKAILLGCLPPEWKKTKQQPAASRPDATEPCSLLLSYGSLQHHAPEAESSISTSQRITH